MVARRQAVEQHHAPPHNRQSLHDLATLIHAPHVPLDDDVGVRETMAAHPEVCDSFPLPLRQLYTIHGASHAAAALGPPSSERSTWTLLSLEDVITEFQHKRRWNPASVSVDFAWTYHGMGHYVAASLDMTRGEVYLRLDGGSNGWEQELNYQLGASYKPKAADCHPVEWWLELVRQGATAETLHGQYVVPV